jgi:hypothetical protein
LRALELSDDDEEDEEATEEEKPTKEEKETEHVQEKEGKENSERVVASKKESGDNNEREKEAFASTHEASTVKGHHESRAMQHDSIVPIGGGGVGKHGVTSRRSGTANGVTMGGGDGETAGRWPTEENHKQKTNMGGWTVDSWRQPRPDKTGGDGDGDGHGNGNGDDHGGDGGDVDGDEYAAAAAREWGKHVEENMQREAEEVCEHSLFNYCYHQ